LGKSCGRRIGLPENLCSSSRGSALSLIGIHLLAGSRELGNLVAVHVLPAAD
jgi:hypothetical protein